MAQHDYDISNQSFPAFRSDLNSVLEAINTSNSGTSRPSSAVAGTIWLDTTSASTPTLKFYDGSDDISLATLDYTANTVNWLDSTVSVDVVGDTTPQLGGNLDVNGNSIVSVANGNITITPDGTGKLIVSGLSYPTADGTADQVLKTDGAGNLSFADAGGGGTQWQSSIKTSNFTAVAGEGYWINTTSGSVTATLPSSASVGDTIEFSDYARTWDTNSVTLNQNGLNFQGFTTPNPLFILAGQSVRIVYSGATQGWIPTSDDDVSDKSTVIYNAEYLVVAGGGSGGTGDAAGGGAGGYLTNYGTGVISLTAGEVYTATVGAGGAGVPGPAAGGSKQRGNPGSDSVLSGTGISIVTSIGGGGGGSGDAGEFDGLDGGSGGGGVSTGSAGSGTAPQGFDGGISIGGGGGASEVGGDGPSPGNYGGDGLQNSITGSATYYAGGGGGNSSGPGGLGGGTDGVTNPASSASSPANTGGGSGGVNDQTSGNGGSGVVILRVATARYSGTTTGSPTVTTDGTDTVIKFTSSGSYTA